MIEIRQRYMDATEHEPMDAYRNVFKSGKFIGTIVRRDIDGRWQWGWIWDTEHAATEEEAAQKLIAQKERER